MTDQRFDFQDLLQLVELMKSTSQFSEFKLRAGGIELELRRGPGATSTPTTTDVAPAPPTASSPAPLTAQAPAAANETRPQAHARQPARAHAVGHTLVKAPMVGTVYLAPEPDAEPFVTAGQSVQAGTQVCIVEVMKLMNSVTAGCDGVVAEILVGDAESVEFGQTLFVIAPA